MYEICCMFYIYITSLFGLRIIHMSYRHMTVDYHIRYIVLILFYVYELTGIFYKEMLLPNPNSLVHKGR